jgi:hypothetical protein
MTRASFDALVTRLAESPTTFSERELLEPSHWSLGEDARLREDLRFRETPWGRWMLAEDLVANDAVYRWLHNEKRGSVACDAALKRASDLFGRRCVFCADDPRFVLRQGEIHLAASELSRQPVVEEQVGDLEKYQTHLPLHSLKAAAASEPAGEWGNRAQDQVIETRGWVRVSLPGRRLNDRMFIAAIEGHSMDDGKSGLIDGGYAVFELWPSGTKQDLSVLVRGTFSDPETGSYAVKKYVADQRDTEGRHNKISLVSLNPNKHRFPNIELTPEDDSDITVVAKVVQALSTDDYERRPKTKRHVGRRNLTGDEQLTRLGRRVASFFDGTPPDADDDDTSTTASTGWQTRLVCLDVGAGGLHLEVGPLEGLPPFVKKLRVIGNQDWDGLALAANARTRPTRLPVRPGTGPWRWVAVGFEEDEDLGVERLAAEALNVVAPIVFRVDADGVGYQNKSATLSLGQAYRLLLPPNVGDTSLGATLDAGWRLWAIDLGAPVSPTTRHSLTALGLNVGEACPRIEWAMTPASAWRTNARGESYPVFEVGMELLINVSGIAVDDGDEAALFLHGAAGTERMPLSSDGLVALGAPTAGRWACALLHPRTSVQSTTLVFEVAEGAPEAVAASYSAVAHSGLASLEATAPAGWPVTLRWRVFGANEELLATLYGNDDGTAPVDGVLSVIEARAAGTRIADLLVDFGELGRRVLPHDGRASLKQVREQLSALWDERKGLVQSRKGAWLQLRKTWFEPVTKLFGYGLEDSAVLADVEAPHDLTAWGLTVDERIMGGITRSSSRVLVLTTDIDAVLRDHRAWLDASCTAGKVRDAIVTDGARWTTHRKGSQQLKQQVWSLEHAIGLGSIDEMLGDLAEGL